MTSDQLVKKTRGPMVSGIVVLSIVFSTVLLVVGGFASPAGAETELEVTTPADGRYQPGQPTPLIVTIEADQAVSGVLSANFDGFLAGSERVEVPGGSAKDIVLIISTPPWASSGSVSFVAADETDNASERVNLVANREDQLVAVLPGLGKRDLPATAELRVDVGQARLYPIDPGLLASGPDALSPFSHLVVTAADLEGLESSDLAAIETWVGGTGGVLIIDEAPTTAIPLRLDERPTGDGGSTRLGVGSVQFTGGVIADEGYDGLISPTPTRSTDEFPWGGGGFGGAPTTLTLARDAGVSVPAIGTLLLVLLVYVAVIGPVLWITLKRVRREPMVWLVLPALALVTTFGVYGVGQALRDSATAAHATVIADVPNMRAVSTQVLVTSPNGGNAGIRLPDGWRPTSTISEEFFFEGPLGQGPSRVEPVLSNGELVAKLPPGGVGVLSAEATLAAAGEPSWRLDLSDDDSRLAGTVTNLTDHELEDVIIAAGQGFQRLQSVAAGETVEVSLTNANVPPMTNDRLMESLWQFDPWSNRNDNGAVNAGVLIDWLSRRPMLRTPGFVLIVGWTRDEAAPLLTTKGATVQPGRTAFITADRLDDDVFGSEPYRLELLRGWNSARVVDQPGNNCAEFPMTLRMATAADRLGPNPVLDLSSQGIAAFDLWDGDEWLPAGMADARTERIVVGVPASALADDDLYLRVLLSCEFWQFANPFPDLRPAGSDDPVLTLGALGEDPADA